MASPQAEHQQPESDKTTPQDDSYASLADKLIAELPKHLRNNIPREIREEEIRRILEESNHSPQQLEAIMHDEGPMVVLAIAGAGKTTVMKQLAKMKILKGMPASQILILSFMNKAVDEMTERLFGDLKEFTHSRPRISTIHRLGSRILKQHANVLGYRANYTMLSDENKEVVLNGALDALDDMARFNLRRDDGEVENLAMQISEWKSSVIFPDDPTIADHELQPAYERYQRILLRKNCMDPDDLILNAIKVLRENPAILKSWQELYGLVIVDEYQDVDKSQVELLRLVTDEHKNLCVVGDDDQCIFSWRGAHVDEIKNFDRTHPKARIVKLETNYRSYQPILNAANALIENVGSRVKKLLISARGQGEIPRVIGYRDEDEQAEHIANEIVEETTTPDADGNTTKYKDYVIEVRNAKSMDAVIQQLIKKDIPFEVRKTDVQHLGETRRNVEALFSLIHDPQADDVSLLQLLESSKFMLPLPDYKLLMHRIDQGCSSLWDVITDESEITHFSEGAQDSFHQLQELITILRERYLRDDSRKKLSSIAKTAIEGLYPEVTPKGWHNNTVKMPDKNATFSLTSDEGEEIEGTDKRLTYTTEVLYATYKDVLKYKHGIVKPSFKAYLAWKQFERQLAKMPKNMDEEELQEKGAVVITTIHRTKGLQWKIVYLIDLNEGYFPSRRTLNAGDDATMDEDLRLAYVAVTRAEDLLRLSFTRRKKYRGVWQPHNPSRYLGMMEGRIKPREKSGQNMMFDS